MNSAGAAVHFCMHKDEEKKNGARWKARWTFVFRNGKWRFPTQYVYVRKRKLRSNQVNFRVNFISGAQKIHAQNIVSKI